MSEDADTRDRMPCGVEDDVVDYVLGSYILSAAADWSNGA
jgi:hypothetical protein